MCLVPFSGLHPVFLLLVEKVILAQVTQVTFRAISEEKEDISEEEEDTEEQIEETDPEMAADGFADWEDSFDGAPEDETLEEALAEERTPRKNHHPTAVHPPMAPRQLHLPEKIFFFFSKTVPVGFV